MGYRPSEGSEGSEAVDSATCEPVTLGWAQPGSFLQHSYVGEGSPLLYQA